MNKYIIGLISCSMLLLSNWSFSQVPTDSIERNVLQAINVQQAKVEITFEWKQMVPKPLFTPYNRHNARRARTTWVPYYKTTQCRGWLTQAGVVVTPTTCLKRFNWELAHITITFVNSSQDKKTIQDVTFRKDIAYIKITPQIIRGINGVTVASISQDKSLKEYFGEDIVKTIFSFFRTKGVNRVPRDIVSEQTNISSSALCLGDGIFYDGKLVALVKKKVKKYRSYSEKPLALFR